MPDRAEIIRAHAIMLAERHKFSVIPIGADKKPAIKWMEYQDRRPSIEEILAWPDAENLAVVTGAVSNLVVVDCDSKEDAQWFWENISKTSTIAKSRRGYHYYFRHPGDKVANGQKINGKYDVRGDGGYALVPPSRHSEGEYTWCKPLVAVDELPLFLPE